MKTEEREKASDDWLSENLSKNTKLSRQDVIKQLDIWINDCGKNADNFFNRGMAISEATSTAMKIAYMNARDLLSK